MRQSLLALFLLFSTLTQAGEGFVRLPWVATPEVDLVDIQGKKISLRDFRGKPLVINFWASWCAACLQEMPSLNRAWKALAKDGIALIAINSGEDRQTVFDYQKRWQMEFPVFMDESLKLTEGFEVRGMPTTFVLDAEGKIVLRALGVRDWDDPLLLEKIRAEK